MYLSILLARRGRHDYEDHRGVTIYRVLFPSFLSRASSRLLSTRYSRPWNSCPLHPHCIPIDTFGFLFLAHLSGDTPISRPLFWPLRGQENMNLQLGVPKQRSAAPQQILSTRHELAV